MDPMSVRCAASLAKLAELVDLETTHEDDRLEVSGHAIRLRAWVEDQGRNERGHVVGIVVEVRLDGALQPFLARSVGVDPRITSTTAPATSVGSSESVISRRLAAAPFLREIWIRTATSMS